MIRGHFVLKRDKEVSKAIEDLLAITSWPRWFAKNVILWRKKERLTISIGRVVE